MHYDPTCYPSAERAAQLLLGRPTDPAYDSPLAHVLDTHPDRRLATDIARGQRLVLYGLAPMDSPVTSAWAIVRSTMMGCSVTLYGAAHTAAAHWREMGGDVARLVTALEAARA